VAVMVLGAGPADVETVTPGSPGGLRAGAARQAECVSQGAMTSVMRR
jgi:hypothetical protein